MEKTFSLGLFYPTTEEKPYDRNTWFPTNYEFYYSG